jgi:hypothetical protein
MKETLEGQHLALTNSRGGDPEDELIFVHFLTPHNFTYGEDPFGLNLTMETNFVSKSDICYMLLFPFIY